MKDDGEPNFLLVGDQVGMKIEDPSINWKCKFQIKNINVRWKKLGVNISRWYHLIVLHSPSVWRGISDNLHLTHPEAAVFACCWSTVSSELSSCHDPFHRRIESLRASVIRIGRIRTACCCWCRHCVWHKQWPFSDMMGWHFDRCFLITRSTSCTIRRLGTQIENVFKQSSGSRHCEQWVLIRRVWWCLQRK